MTFDAAIDERITLLRGVWLFSAASDDDELAHRGVVAQAARDRGHRDHEPR